MRWFCLFLALLSPQLFANSAPGTAVLNRRDVLEFIIDSQNPEKLGAWTLYLSNDLSTGSNSTWGGLKGVDFKIEDQSLFRFQQDQDPQWKRLGQVQLWNKGAFQILQLPKSIFLKPEGQLQWRWAFFPSPSRTPIFSPNTNPGSLDLKEYADIGPSTSHSIETSYFLASDNNKSFPWRTFNHSSNLNLQNLFIKRIQQRATPQLFFPNTTWWASLSPDIKDHLKAESEAGSEIHSTNENIIYPPLNQLRSHDNQKVQEARQKASHLMNQRAFFILTPKDHLPANADGAILHHHRMDLKSLEQWLLRIVEIRKNYTGPLWAMISEQYFDLEGKLLENYQKLLLKHRVLPILEPSSDLSLLHSHQLSRLAWLQLQVLERIKKPRLDSKRLPFPKLLYKKLPSNRLRSLDHELWVQKVYSYLGTNLSQQLQVQP